MKKSRRRGYTLIEFLVVLGIVAFLAALLFPVVSYDRGGARRASCQSNLKQIGLGMMQYTQDYDEKFVPTAIGSTYFGWGDALQIYIKSTQVYRCPSAGTSATSGNWLANALRSPAPAPRQDPRQRGYTDYWMNAALSRVRLEKISDPAYTILSGDGNDGTDATDARYSLRALPQKWLKDEKSPAHRHLKYTNILFADGHVKALRPEKIVASATPEYKDAFVLKWRP